MVAGLCELLRIAVASRPYRFNRTPQYSTLLSPAPRQQWSFFSDGYEGGSSVYEHALKFQRPSTIKYRHELNNSISLIGRVINPLKRVNGDKLGVYTFLRVKGNSQSDRDVRIQLMMWRCIAEKCMNHLKENDLIHVNGSLKSYAKRVADGMFYKVLVKEIDYVTPMIGQKFLGEAQNSHLQEEDYAGRCRNRLHLWQVIFANPYEWTDLRKKKTNPKQPDFIHKSTDEGLWLKRSDPSWVKEQLQKLDSAMADKSPEEGQKTYPAKSPEVLVKEIDYVTPMIGQKFLGEAQNSHLQEEDYAGRCRNRLHLWQVIFANPYEWTDLRKKKTNPKQPDFIHKSTDEGLWLKRSDPSWVKEQLQKLDSAMADKSPVEGQKTYPARSPEVLVKEIDYVTPMIGQKVLGEAQNSHLQEEDYADRCRNRLHLWQVFFANPYEWTDLRKKKTNPKQPDFKHKSTGEALWLQRSDPSWVKKQLQKLDSAMADKSLEEGQKTYPAGHFL